MQHKYFFRLLFALSLTGLLLLPLQWLVTASPPPPLARHTTPLQPSVDTRNPLLLEPASPNSELVLYPSDDAAVQEGAPSSTDPENFYLGAGYYQSFPYGANGRVRSYIRFDLSSLPTDSTIVSATLRIYHAGGADYPGQTRTTDFHRVISNWSETSITWNNRPDYAETIGNFETTYNFQGWLNLDLTTQVRSWVAGSQDNYGLVAIGYEGTPGIYRVFASGETDHSPELRVRYLPPLSPVLDAWPGDLSIRASSTWLPSAAQLEISNVTNGSLNWSATKVGDAAWLELSKSSGSATPTASDNIVFTIDPTGLPSDTLVPGTYTEQIRISSDTPEVEGSPLTVTFSLEVVDHLYTVYLPLVLRGEGSGPSSSQIVALIVGIADYQYASDSLEFGRLPDDWGTGDLYAPGHDADDFQALIINEFGAPQDNIVRYGDTESTPCSVATTRRKPDISSTQQCYPLATRANVVAAFGQLDDMEDKETTVIFYFSGHGGQTFDDNGDESDGYDEFIAMYDTNTDASGFVNVLTDDDLQTLLANLESQHIIVILDSCYSGGMMNATQVSGDLLQRGLWNPQQSAVNSVQRDEAVLTELVGPGRVIITAGTGDQGTWESNALENGVFTYFFLQGLQDSLNDANHNDRISAEEAYWFSKDAVDDWVATNVDVTPVPHQNPDIGDQHFGQIDLMWLP